MKVHQGTLQPACSCEQVRGWKQHGGAQCAPRKPGIATTSA